MSQIAVLDLGTGNLRSVAKAAEHAAGSRWNVTVTREPSLIEKADRIIVPGQGAIESWMAALSNESLRAAVLSGLKNKPVLAICVGMQALFDYDHEHGGHECLGLFKGEVVRFEQGKLDEQGLPMKVPQMGWNQMKKTATHPLWQGIADNSWFYFLHSYFVSTVEKEIIVGETQYGITYASAVARDNIFAIQCHPEKSHNAGIKLIENFVNWRV